MTLKWLIAAWKRRVRRGLSERSRRYRPHAELLEDRTTPSTVTWIGGSGDWDTASNWSNGKVPGAADDVAINNAAITVSHNTGVADSVNSLTSQAALSISAGSLSLASASSVNGSLTLSGGTISGSSITLTDAGGGTVTGGTLSGVFLDNPSGETLTLQGSGTLNLVNGARLQNYGLVALPNDQSGITGDSSAVFDNYGTLQKTSGVTTKYENIGVAFNNYGVVDLQQGELLFAYGLTTVGTTAYAGSSFTGAAGTFFGFYGLGDFQAGSSISGDMVGFAIVGPVAGTFQANQTYIVVDPLAFTGTVNSLGAVSVYANGALDLTAATLTPAAYTLTSLDIESGSTVRTTGAFTVTGALTLNGILQMTNTLTLNGALTSNGGELDAESGPLTLTTPSGATIISLTLSGITLDNPAGQTLTLQGPGTLNLVNGAGLANYGLVALPNDLSGITGDNSAVFDNYGTLQKTSGVTTRYENVGVAFNNHGVVDLEQGELLFAYGLTTVGTTAYAGSSFTGAAGTFFGFYGLGDFQAGSSISGDMVGFAIVGPVAGTFQANQTYIVVDPLAFTGTVNSLGAVSVYANGALDLTAATLTPAAYTLTSLDIESGSTVRTTGAFTVTGALTLNGILQMTNTLTLNGALTSNGGELDAESGPLTLTTPSGATIISLTLSGITLDNPAGQTLTLQGPGTLNLVNGAGLANYGLVALPNDLSGITGDNSAVFDNYGTLQKTSGVTTRYENVGVAFNNHGVVDLEQGELLFAYGLTTVGTTAYAGSSFTGAAGTFFGFYGLGDFQAGSSISGDMVGFAIVGPVAGTFQANQTYIVVDPLAFTGTVNSLGAVSVYANGALDLTAATLAHGGAVFTSLDVENGSSLLASGKLTDAGNLIVNGGTLTGTAYLLVAGQSILGGNGTLSNSGGLTTQGGLTINGTLNINTTIQDSTAFHSNPQDVLNFDISGSNPGQFGQLNISDYAYLDGTLSATLMNGYTPASGSSFPVLSFAGFPSNFAQDGGSIPSPLAPVYTVNGINLVTNGTPTTPEKIKALESSPPPPPLPVIPPPPDTGGGTTQQPVSPLVVEEPPSTLPVEGPLTPPTLNLLTTDEPKAPVFSEANALGANTATPTAISVAPTIASPPSLEGLTTGSGGLSAIVPTTTTTPGLVAGSTPPPSPLDNNAAPVLSIELPRLASTETVSSDKIASSLLTGNPLRADLLPQQGSQVGPVGTLLTDDIGARKPTQVDGPVEDEFSLKRCLIGINRVQEPIAPRSSDSQLLPPLMVDLSSDLDGLIGHVAHWLQAARTVTHDRRQTKAPLGRQSIEDRESEDTATESSSWSVPHIASFFAAAAGLTGLLVRAQSRSDDEENAPSVSNAPGVPG